MEEIIKRICKRRNVIYKDYKDTIYYYSCLDLILGNKQYITESDIIENAKKYAIEKFSKLNNELDTSLLIVILNSDNARIKEIVMSIIAKYDNLDDFPHKCLLQLNSIISNSNDDYSINDISKTINDIFTALEIKKEGTDSQDNWYLPSLYELVRNNSILHNYNDYDEYLQILDRKGLRAQYTDYATILCRFVNSFSFGRANENKGTLCSDSIENSFPYQHTSFFRIIDDNLSEGSKSIDENSEVAGIRPILKYYFDSIPRNDSYIVQNEAETEYGYWPKTVANRTVQSILDNLYGDETSADNIRHIGDITTGISKSDDGNLDIEKSPCFEYNGEIYAHVKAKFYDGIVTEGVAFSDGNRYNSNDSIWVKIEPLKCYVDKSTSKIITQDIIISGIKPKDVDYYLKRFFSSELHQFDRFFKFRESIGKNEKEKPDIQNQDRTILLELIDEYINNPKKICKSEMELAETTNQQEDIQLNGAIKKYEELSNKDIIVSEIDDYIRVVDRLINTFGQLGFINKKTIDRLFEFLEPLQRYNNINNRINDIFEKGAGAKIYDDSTSIERIKEMQPKINLIIEIIFQKYQSKEDEDSVSKTKQLEEKDKIEQFMEATKSYNDYLNHIEQSDYIDEYAYRFFATLKRLKTVIQMFVKDGEQFRENFERLISPLEEILDVNNRIIGLINCNNIDEHISREYQNFKNEIDSIVNRIQAIFDVIVENYNIREMSSYSNMERMEVGTEEDKSFLNPLKYLKGLFKPKDIKKQGIDRKQEPNSFTDLRVKTPIINQIENASLDETKQVLESYNDESKQGLLRNLKAKLMSENYLYFGCKSKDLIFIVMKNTEHNRIHIYTNNSEIGHFEFWVEGDSVYYENDYWKDGQKHTIDIEKKGRGLLPKKRIIFSTDDYHEELGEIERHRDEYDELSDNISIRNDGDTNIFNYNSYKNNYEALSKAGMNQLVISAARGDIKDVVPQEVILILKKYAPDITALIGENDRIFVDGEQQY